MFRLGRLASISDQLEALQREFTGLKEKIAFEIVDYVAARGKGHLAVDVSSAEGWRRLPEETVKICLEQAEVDTLQQIIFDGE